FEGSLGALALIQALIFFPVVFRVLWPLLQNPSAPLRQLARTLGASPLRAWWEVEWPRLRRPVVQCLAMVGAASLGEVSAVSFFSSEKVQTLPLLVSRSMAQYRFEYASVVAALLFLISGLLVLSFRMERYR
ncbi:ABC transporter permease subunit, partial [bacterium]|nr:ABC transporter permease subunit [bacterium]